MLPDSVILYKSDATFYVKSIKLIDMELPGFAIKGRSVL